MFILTKFFAFYVDRPLHSGSLSVKEKYKITYKKVRKESERQELYGPRLYVLKDNGIKSIFSQGVILQTLKSMT